MGVQRGENALSFGLLEGQGQNESNHHEQGGSFVFLLFF